MAALVVSQAAAAALLDEGPLAYASYGGGGGGEEPEYAGCTADRLDVLWFPPQQHRWLRLAARC